ncbi:MFS transporter [Nocardia concava]|uniref:MFS transporter n=1 Tax=Nocardia concava TaxID=257281 RepID=UPI0002E389EF|nr:MFS transporter [Nocardia concava]
MLRNRTDASGSGTVLATLACGQFLMILDSSVMNVSMASVSEDLNTPISGIQTAITLYTLVMASLMITGGRAGAMLGRRRAFGIGLIVYGAGSLTTALSPNLVVLLIGWSLLEGLGATLILPAIVALVSANFPPARRTAAYGMIAAAGAVAVAVGPLLGGAVTTYASWRYVFLGEVVVVAGILLLLRRIHDTGAGSAGLDPFGSLLSVTGLGAAVFGVLQSGQWGWVRPRPGKPEWAGLSPVIWLILFGIAVLYGFFRWQTHLAETGGDPLIDPDLLRLRQLTGGLGMFFAQYFVQGGVFFTVPLFLSVILELSAVGTGLRILPLSGALVLAAVGIPKAVPRANPRRVVRLGLTSMIIGILILMGGLNPGANAGIVMIPMLFLGLGLGALSSQLGAVTTGAVPDSQTPEVGGLQNTATSLGTSLGTALIGSVLVAALTTATGRGIENTEAQFTALRAGLAITALFALGALFGTGRIPGEPVGGGR